MEHTFPEPPKHFNCRSFTEGLRLYGYSKDDISRGLIRLSQELSNRGLADAAVEVLLPEGPTSAPSSWENLANAIGWKDMVRLRRAGFSGS